MDPVSLYIPEALENVPLALWFMPPRKGVFDEKFPPNFFEHRVKRVAHDSARAIVLQNNFLSTDERTTAYIEKYAALGEKLKIPVFIFSIGDFTDHLHFDPRVHVFTFSAYASTVDTQHIVMPTLTEDLGREGITLRAKEEVPVVSFCGKGGFSSPREALAAWLKRLPLEIHGVFHREARARIRGVFWRIWAIRACSTSPLLRTLFIIRKTFSGAHKTIELDPKVAREDFIRSVRESDFVLAPKGDGNYSNRFLEALAMGRFPVVPDTDCVFPLEEKIDYKKVVVVVPMNKLHKTPTYIRKFYDALTPEEYTSRQTFARSIFEQYLKQDSFFRQFFAKV